MANLLIEELPTSNRRLKKRNNSLSGQGFSKIDGIISLINSVNLMEEPGARFFEVGAFIS